MQDDSGGTNPWIKNSDIKALRHLRCAAFDNKDRAMQSDTPNEAILSEGCNQARHANLDQ